MSIVQVDRRAWHALFAAQLGWMLDAMDFLLFNFAVIQIQKEFVLSKTTVGLLLGALPAIAAFFIRRGVEEPPIWRTRKETKSDWFEMFSRPFRRQTLVVTSVAASVLLAYWGVTSWLPSFLAAPVAEGGAGMTI